MASPPPEMLRGWRDGRRHPPETASGKTHLCGHVILPLPKLKVGRPVCLSGNQTVCVISGRMYVITVDSWRGRIVCINR